MATVLVTGASGYVAGWCIVQALQAGHTVRGTVRSQSKADQVRAEVSAQADTARLELVEADLLSDAGWPEAVQGCDYVLHVASPLVARDEQVMIDTAREGALRVLRAAVDAGVKRVVLTSSCAAATPPGKADVVVDENTWTDAGEPGLAAYRRSKVLAEKAAWDFMAEHPDTELVTILPASIFGPAISAESASTLSLLKQVLTGGLPVLPNMMLQVVDVRDVAAAHLLAMTVPEAAGRRFITSGQLLSLRQVARVFRTEVPELSRRVSRIPAPDWTLRAAARVAPPLRSLVPLLGRMLRHDSTAARTVLGWTPRPATETLVDSARCLAGFGQLPDKR